MLPVTPVPRIACAFLLACTTAMASAQVVIGGPLNKYEELAPAFRSLPDKGDVGKLRDALRAAGDLTLNRTVLVIGAADQPPQTVHLTARALKLEGSTIVTNGHKLVIHAEQVVADGASKVVAIADDAPRKQPPGPAGSRAPDGRGGRAAGEVELYMLKPVEGRLVLDLEGQDGQDGADGGKGADGAAGAKGRSSKVKHGFCKRGAKPGGPGGDGAPGGHGGNGGDGGAGGLLNVVFYNAPVHVDRLVYDVDAGAPGRKGEAGAGGKGGPGGPRGSNRSPCSWNSPDPGNGPRGRDASAGQSGQDGKAGAAGRFQAQRIDLPSPG